jgi:hypothetical protein
MAAHTTAIPSADTTMTCIVGGKFDTSLSNGVINCSMIFFFIIALKG